MLDRRVNNRDTSRIERKGLPVSSQQEDPRRPGRDRRSRSRLTAVAAAQEEDGDKVVFTVGITNDFDTLNPLVGVEVPDYEVWNLQYATLTDKAASDFHTIPGLAESWESSNGGKTYTYTLRDGLKWSDGEPLTAEDVAYTVNRAREEEWLNYNSTVANLTAKAIDDRPSRSPARCPTRSCRRWTSYILPKHIWEKYDAKAITKYNGQDGVGCGPFTLVEAKRGPVLAHEGEPELLGRQAGGGRGRLPPLQQRGRDGRRAEEGRDRRGARRSDRARSRISSPPRASSPSRASRAASTSSPSTAAPASRSRIPRCST